MTITAAADGSSLGNPGPTGWAWYIDDDTWAAGGFPTGTNNIGELTAVAELLDATAHVDEPLHILCDSKYVIDSCTKWMRGWKYNGWKKKDGKPVLNVELMQRLDAALAGRRVTFQWVKGHAGHPENEAADERARAAATAYARGREPLRGPGFPGAGAGASVSAGDGAGAGVVAAAGGGAADALTEVPEDPRVSARADDAEERSALDVRGDGSLPLWEDDEHTATDAHVLGALERDRLDAMARADAARLDELLHDEYAHIDADGTSVGREAVLGAARAARAAHTADAAGGAEADLLALTGFATQAIASSVQLVTYETHLEEGPVRCSTVWVFEVDAPREGRWRARFHQVTPQR